MKKMIFPAVLIGAAVGTTIAAASYVMTREYENKDLLLDTEIDQPESVYVEDLNGDYKEDNIEDVNIVISEDELIVEEDNDELEQVVLPLTMDETEESAYTIEDAYLEGEQTERNPFVLDLSADAEALKSTFEAIIEGTDVEETETPEEEVIEETITTQIDIEPQDFTQELTSNDTIDLANFDAATFLIDDEVEELGDIKTDIIEEKKYVFDPNSEPTLDDLEKLCESLVERIS